MKKKQIVDLITAIILIICGSALLVFPFFGVIDIKLIFMSVLAVYSFMNFIQFLLVRDSKDYEGLFTSIASIIVLIIAWRLNIKEIPWYLALSLFIWIIFMALIKLKKADYYHDRENKTWILKVVTLIIFVLCGLLVTINLYYANDVQVIILGFFYLIHGILELLDPLTVYLIESK